MSHNVVPLRHNTESAVQVEVLDRLSEVLGQDESRELIEKAVFELSDRLWMLEKALHAQALEEVVRIAKSFIKLSEQFGLSELSLVATHLAHSYKFDDATTSWAIAARLIRVGEQSLHFAVSYPESAS